MELSKRILSLFVAVVIVLTSALSVSASGFLEGESDFFKFAETLGSYIRDAWNNFCIIFSLGFDRINEKEYSQETYDVPGLADGFIPQGMCFVETMGCFAVSGYKDGQDSGIYLIRQSDGATGEIILKGYKGHAGGIASFENDIYVCSGGNATEGGYVYRLSAEELSKVFNTEDGKLEVSLSEKFQTYVRASFMCIGDGMLFVGEFYNSGNTVDKAHYYDCNRAWACGYKLPVETSFDGEQVIPDAVLSIPDQVQGMAVTDNKKVVFSTSYGRDFDSVLYAFDGYESWKNSTVSIGGKDVPIYISGKENRIAKVKMPTLMEGTDYVGGSLYIVFESGAIKYFDAKKVIKKIYKTDIDAIIERCESR